MEVAHPESWFFVYLIPSRMEFGRVGFLGKGKTRVPGEKPLGARERTNKKLNPRTASTPGFQPRPHWWEVGALANAPSLAPQRLLAQNSP